MPTADRQSSGMGGRRLSYGEVKAHIHHQEQLKEAELQALRGHHRSSSNRADYRKDGSNLRHQIAQHSPASIRNKAVMESADY